MQDEVNEKVVSLAIKTSKLTAEVLQKAMKALLAKGKGQLTKAPHGKITMRQLMKPGEKVSNIEITDQNIKAFDPIARKNGLDYNVKKIENGKPPTYLVSFRGKARKRICKGSGKAVCKGKHLAGKVSPRRKAYRLSDFVKEIDKEQIGGI